MDAGLSFKLIDVYGLTNVSSAEVPDAEVLKMIKRAEVVLELETGKESDCRRVEIMKEKERGLVALSLCSLVVCFSYVS